MLSMVGAILLLCSHPAIEAWMMGSLGWTSSVPNLQNAVQAMLNYSHHNMLVDALASVKLEMH